MSLKKNGTPTTNMQWRYDYLVKEILLPIKNSGRINKLIELYDKENDNYILELLDILQGSILILKYIFLQRKELKGYLDFIIYINAPKKLRLKRVFKRDFYIGEIEDIKINIINDIFPQKKNIS